jgi:hypothetical protein
VTKRYVVGEKGVGLILCYTPRRVSAKGDFERVYGRSREGVSLTAPLRHPQRRPGKRDGKRAPNWTFRVCPTPIPQFSAYSSGRK